MPRPYEKKGPPLLRWQAPVRSPIDNQPQRQTPHGEASELSPNKTPDPEAGDREDQREGEFYQSHPNLGNAPQPKLHVSSEQGVVRVSQCPKREAPSEGAKNRDGLGALEKMRHGWSQTPGERQPDHTYRDVDYESHLSRPASMGRYIDERCAGTEVADRLYVGNENQTECEKAEVFGNQEPGQDGQSHQRNELARPHGDECPNHTPRRKLSQGARLHPMVFSVFGDDSISHRGTQPGAPLCEVSPRTTGDRTVHIAGKEFGGPWLSGTNDRAPDSKGSPPV